MGKIRAAITGIEAYVPDDLLTNADLEKMVDTSDEWIMSRTGIKERHILKGEGKGSSDLGAEAVLRLLKKTNTSPDDIDLIVCATVTPDMLFPANAAIIADKVGIKKAHGFDINAACSGFIFGMDVCEKYIQTGYKKIILVATDKMSSVVDYTDRQTCILFGDAGTAVLIEPSTDEVGMMDSILRMDGVGRNFLYLKGGGSQYPASHQTVDNKDHFIFQDGQPVFKYAVSNMADISDEIMKRNNLSSDDVAWLVPHQANLRIIDATARRMGLGTDKVMINISRYGNTTAATIPLCLWEWEKSLKKGDNLILTAFGGGFTWGTIFLKWAYDSK